MSTAKKTSLTRRQREIYEFLKDKILNRGYGPTVREIGQHFGIRSPNGVMCHLRALERKGLISRQQNMSRAIQLAESLNSRLSVPVIGTAVPGGPFQPCTSEEEAVNFEATMGSGEGMCIRVESNSYASLNILSGDTLILNQNLPLASGCHVAALDERHSLVVCTVSELTGQLTPLLPGSWTPSTRQTLGVITGLIRRFRLPPAPVETPQTAADSEPDPEFTTRSVQF
jgi:repressor LexA